MKRRPVTLTQRELAQALARDGRMAEAIGVLHPETPVLPALGPDSPLRPAKRRLAGQLARGAGAAFQRDIRMTLDWYAERKQLVYAEGNPRVGGAPYRMFPVEASRVDFTGLAARVPFAFDCKTSHHASFSLSDTTKETERRTRQAEWLVQFQAQGGLAFFLVYDSRRERIAFVTGLAALLAGAAVPLAEPGPDCRIIYAPAATPPRWRLLGGLRCLAEWAR